MTAPTTHCGYVSLLGAPNVGKSSLLNRMVGEPLSIVTAKAQTTWKRVTGLRTTETHQMIFLDTPGVFRAENTLHKVFVGAAREAAREADVLLLVVDPDRPLDPAGRDLLREAVGLAACPRLGVINKVDVVSPEAVLAEEEWLSSLGVPVFQVSALSGEGVDELIREAERLLPAGPFLYPPDDVATEPVRFFAAEFVREAIFEEYHDEIPYASFCEVQEFREEGERAYVQVVIYVERTSQKGIVIGKEGRAIREVGMKARARLEAFLGRPVYLDLWVKVLPDWRRKVGQLRKLGFAVPDQEGPVD